MIRAAGTGKLPTPSTSSGTAFSQLSSCESNVVLLFVYHEPACVAALSGLSGIMAKMLAFE